MHIECVCVRALLQYAAYHTTGNVKQQKSESSAVPIRSLQLSRMDPSLPTLRYLVGSLSLFLSLCVTTQIALFRGRGSVPVLPPSTSQPSLQSTNPVPSDPPRPRDGAPTLLAGEGREGVPPLG